MWIGTQSFLVSKLKTFRKISEKLKSYFDSSDIVENPHIFS